MEKTNMFKKLLNIKAKGIKLQRDTEAFNYKYATLSQIQDKFSDELQAQKLLVIHYIKDNEVVTEIRDTESEGFVKSSIQMNDDVKAQDKGSEITYFRRYNLLSLLDLEVEDDDGKKATESKKFEGKKTDTDNLPWIADENISNLKKLTNEGQSFTIKDIRAKYKVSKANAEKLSLLGIN